MTLRIKARLLTSIIFLFLIIILAIMLKYLLLDRLSVMERRDASEDIHRVSVAITGELSSLEKELSDRTELAEINKKNPKSDFLTTTFPDSTFSKFGINLAVSVSQSGQIINGGFKYPNTDKRVDVPKSISQVLKTGFHLLSNYTTRSGVILLPEGPMLIASKPVVDKSKNKLASGVIIIGRIIDNAFIARTIQATQLPISVHTLNAPNYSGDFRTAMYHLERTPEGKYISLDDNHITAFTLIRDIFGKPALILSVKSGREIYDCGNNISRYLMLWFSLAALIAALIINTLFDKLVFSKFKGKEIQDRYQSVVNQAAEGVVIIDFKNKNILEGNDAFYGLLGYSRDEGTDILISGIIVDDEAQTIEHAILRFLKEKREIKLRHKDGSLLDAEISASFISHQGKDAVCFLIHDMTERKRLADRLEYEATHDSLTGLPNRNLLNDLLSRALSHDKRYKKTLVLLLLDLDNFKIVNDTLGHSAGDELLKEVASRLRQCVRRYDTVARLGGDEFAIVLSGISHDNDVTSVVDKIRSVFTHPFRINEHEMFITCSIGIALAQADGDRAEDLLSNADIAMYYVKGSGKSNYQFFSAEMNARISGRLEMETRLRRAVDREEFILHYQPKIELSTGKIVGMEALLRWQTEEGVLMPPSEFIHLLDDTGLIVSVSGWVLREACRQNKAWQDAGLPPLVVSTNISARHFYQNNLPEAIKKVLHESGLQSRYLKIELTESIIMRDIDEAARQLNRLKEMGISLSIDDFGTGYASFEYLKRFPVDEIKIDRSFVSGVPNDANDATIVSTVIALAHKMNLEVVAEGVENEQQLGFLAERNCHQVQGFYFSRPLPGKLFEETIRNGLIVKDRIPSSGLIQAVLD
jgi:diguanylate cyclase (GGDEF)-like protein/PAS domain S-box-containing protein